MAQIPHSPEASSSTLPSTRTSSITDVEKRARSASIPSSSELTVTSMIDHEHKDDKSRLAETEKRNTEDQSQVIPVAEDAGALEEEVPEKDGRNAQESALQEQSTRLPFHRLLLIYFGIGLALFLSFLDQTGVSTSAPVIGSDLGGSNSIAWVGTSFLVANCAMHLVYGRLSDIFGRKLMLQVALCFLGFGNLLCGFAKTPIQLYIFRAISGLGGGGVNGIAMTVVSDIVSLKDRGKYQGLISASCSLGSAIGPFVGGGLASIGAWRWLFWMTTILSAFVIGSTHFILPLKPVTGSIKVKLAQIDYLGIFLSAAGTVLLLVPISGGGSTFAWNSPTVIVLLIVGAGLMGAFLFSQWKLAKLPILPLRLFKTPTVSVILAQSFLVGVIYYGNIFYVPMYFQYIMGFSALKSGEMVLIYTLPQSLWGILSGQIVSRTNRYKMVIIVGSGLWCLGAGLQVMWHRGTHLGVVLGILQVNSIGVGFCLQTTLVAMMAVTPNGDRAVVTSSRNFFRTMGGAFGLAVSNALFNNVISAKLPSTLSPALKAQILESALTVIETLPEDVKDQVLDAYAEGLRSCFAFFTAISGICFLLAFLIKEVTFRKDPPGLRKETKEEARPELVKSDIESNSERGEKTSIVDDATAPRNESIVLPKL